jgi:hypothetical protein
MVSENFTPPAPPIGVIESLTTGFETVAGRLTLILIPLILDLVLWAGPRISYEPALKSLSQMEGENSQNSNIWQQLLFPLFPEEYFHPMTSEQYMPVLAVPSVMAIRDARELPFAATPPVIPVSSISGLVIAGLIALQVGVLTLIPYWGFIGHAVLTEPVKFGRMVKQVLSVSAQVLVFEIVVGAVTCMVLFASLMALSAMWLVGREGAYPLVWILVIILLSICLTVNLLLCFTLHSMILNRRNILAAMWDSMRVVQWNMPSTLGLQMLTIMIYFGMQVIWRMADPGSWAALIAIVGNAFISTGLAAASFVFFKDRYRYWSEFRQQLIAELERRRVIQDSKNKES